MLYSKEHYIKELEDNQLICTRPFFAFEVDFNGNVYCCCPEYVNNIALGNVFEQSFEEIWHGKNYHDFRLNVLKSKYSKCELQECYKRDCFIMPQKEFDNLYKQFDKYYNSPRFVALNVDTACNISCVFCRDVKRPNPKYFKQNKTNEKLYQTLLNENDLVTQHFNIIDSFYMPLLENAEILHVNSLGEPFASPFYKILFNKLKDRDDLKIAIITNGTLCNEKILKEYGLLNKLDSVIVSVHAATKETYNKLVKGSDFDRVIENIKNLKSLKEANIFKEMSFNFTVTSLNYKEMPAFVELAKDLGADIVNFNKLIGDNEYSTFCQNAELYDVTLTEHPEHSQFLRILENPIFEKYGVVTENIL